MLNACTTTILTTTLTPATCHAVEADDVQADADAPCGHIAQLRMPLIMMMTGVTWTQHDIYELQNKGENKQQQRKSEWERERMKDNEARAGLQMVYMNILYKQITFTYIICVFIIIYFMICWLNFKMFTAINLIPLVLENECIEKRVRREVFSLVVCVL